MTIETSSGPIARAIEQKLRSAFDPSALEVIDESHLHAHHAGAKAHQAAGGSAESHFHVRISADAIPGATRLARHRAVMELLAEELAGPVHALRLSLIS